MKERRTILIVIFVTTLLTFGLTAIASGIASNGEGLGNYSGWDPDILLYISVVLLIIAGISLVGIIVTAFYRVNKKNGQD